MALQAAWEVLYDVSHQWRSLALDYSCGSLHRSLYGFQPEHLFGNVSITRSYYYLGDKNLHYVRKVRIHLRGTLLNLLNVAQAQELDRAKPEDFALPSATFVVIDLQFTMPDDAEHRAAFTSAFSWVADRIKVTMPNLRRVKICFGNDTLAMEMSAQSFISKESSVDTLLLACLIRRNWRERQMTADRMGTSVSPLQGTPQLTTFHCSCYSGTDPYNRIVKRCAPTLEELHIEKLACCLARPFFIHKDGRPVIFPRLRFLFMQALKSKGYKRLRTDKAAVPFPVLQYIKLDSRYVFADDTLFRGNEDTLKYLFIDIDHKSLEILQRHQVFSDGKYSHLRYVRAARNHVSRRKLSKEPFLKFSLGILSLKLFEMFKFIRFLPNMTDFKCHFGGIGLELDKGQASMLPDNLYSTYYPLSRNLKCWSAWCSIDMPQEKLAAASITLALLCPKFTLTGVLNIDPLEYHDELKKVLSSGLYDKYAEKIRRLFYYE
ncbi:hypothetical protein IW140_003070 [Coemansia sp. RSA 1813]|nr:hypothetical protein IW140_003070 [Coemansia sp. RSA 1813]